MLITLLAVSWTHQRYRRLTTTRALVALLAKYDEVLLPRTYSLSLAILLLPVDSPRGGLDSISNKTKKISNCPTISVSPGQVKYHGHVSEALPQR